MKKSLRGRAVAIAASMTVLGVGLGLAAPAVASAAVAVDCREVIYRYDRSHKDFLDAQHLYNIYRERGDEAGASRYRLQMNVAQATAAIGYGDCAPYMGQERPDPVRW
ncbi:hypothetical protein [Kibdelosporangium aridum]|uniref:Uncharacterized protein n=1 Tax=Kibdelosporangium aridum TaxID=2030 RepID=A0A1W2FWX6_KIBAR|nr:hypothetical protein [Kibdelosporangium aridum]SMD26425.1 hypothetical protein SAMN05661093_10008 [Kibdelosporangium aridum]